MKRAKFQSKNWKKLLSVVKRLRNTLMTCVVRAVWYLVFLAKGRSMPYPFRSHDWNSKEYVREWAKARTGEKKIDGSSSN